MVICRAVFIRLLPVGNEAFILITENTGYRINERLVLVNEISEEAHIVNDVHDFGDRLNSRSNGDNRFCFKVIVKCAEDALFTEELILDFPQLRGVISAGADLITEEGNELIYNRFECINTIGSKQHFDGLTIFKVLIQRLGVLVTAEEDHKRIDELVERLLLEH